MVVLTAHYVTRPEDTDAILTDLATMTELVRMHEPGCAEYRVLRRVDQPHELLLYEAYQDQAALEAHSATAYFQEIVLGRIVPRLISRERTLWTVAGDPV
ncbi:putative quinol monooxygenase [Sulfobacillus harzensis]|uniref:Antibiotic biosynthesis monooxygenase n=1 Tax=Sulfobacillus harzensis TaxID=2729629 RepID=A0A7Y0L429_9FIRM|nr:antibiotic biosynthesis monooxygenase [Sulfobacillus harzensis]NMP22949.1 antibiotic biosynthesis monooxygenase [Sulfobacillus harzensis]